MTIFLAILAPLFGILGVVVGVLCNEYLRRKNRREVFAPKVFERRLGVYEGLAELVQEGGEIADQAIEDASLAPEERHALVSKAVLDVAGYVDRHRLYIDDEVGTHCAAVFMGVEEIHDSKEEVKAQLLQHYYEMRAEAFRMISEDSGIAEINELFKTINRPNISGNFVEYLRKARAKQRSRGASARGRGFR
jgi:hypothetical protein